jgi:hypothetical protein
MKGSLNGIVSDAVCRLPPADRHELAMEALAVIRDGHFGSRAAQELDLRLLKESRIARRRPSRPHDHFKHGLTLERLTSSRTMRDSALALEPAELDSKPTRGAAPAG